MGATAPPFTNMTTLLRAIPSKNRKRSMINIFPEFEIVPWRIRKFNMADINLVSEASKDPLIPLITSIPAIFSDEEGKAYIERQWNRYNEGTGYSFAIAESETNNAIGSVYLGLQNIEEGRASIGYWIIKNFRGKGAATVALMYVSKWAQAELRIPRLELYVEPWNTASIKTAEAAGFKREGIMRSWKKVGNERKDMIMMSLVQ